MPQRGVLGLSPGVGECGADMKGPDKVCSTLGWEKMLPLRHGGLGLHMPSDEAFDAALLASGAGQAERNLKGRPAALCPLQGRSCASMRQWRSSLHTRNADQCGWDTAAMDVPTEFLDSSHEPRRGLQAPDQTPKRKREDACHVNMLSGFDVNTTQWQHDIARLRSSFGGPVGEFLTATAGS